MTHLKKYFHNRKRLMGYNSQQNSEDKDHTSPQSPLCKRLEPPECGYSGDLLAPADTLSGLEKFKLRYGENWRMIYYGEG